MPVAQAFDPDLILVSSGFDAARGDPLGGCDLTPAGYAHMTHRLLSLGRGKVVVALEGGYNLTSISRGMEAVLRVLLGQAPPPLLRVPARTHSKPSAMASQLGGASGAAGAALDSLTGATPKPTAADAGDSNASAGGVGAGANAAGVSGGSAAANDGDAATADAGAHEDNDDGDDDDDGSLNEAYEGMGRSDVLTDVAPSSSALESIATTLVAHAKYWPALRRKFRAYSHIAEAAYKKRMEKEREKEAAATGVTAGAAAAAVGAAAAPATVQQRGTGSTLAAIFRGERDVARAPAASVSGAGDSSSERGGVQDRQFRVSEILAGDEAEDDEDDEENEEEEGDAEGPGDGDDDLDGGDHMQPEDEDDDDIDDGDDGQPEDERQRGAKKARLAENVADHRLELDDADVDLDSSFSAGGAAAGPASSHRALAVAAASGSEVSRGNNVNIDAAEDFGFGEHSEIDNH